MTLATRLPYSHPFAGGYPRIGGQPLPTDPDAIDYLNRQAAVDGPVEVGVAMAVDQFIKGCKADSAGYAGDPTRTVWDALQACCIMCGARTISGALVPLVGTAPTAQGGWAAGDYDRSTGLKGDGSSLYLDSNRANDADGQDDQHLAVFAPDTLTGTKFLAGAGVSDSGTTSIINASGTDLSIRSRNGTSVTAAGGAVGFIGVSRQASDAVKLRGNSQTYDRSSASQDPLTANIHVFATSGTTSNRSDARLAFYSIGSSLDLAALDNRVSTLITAIAAALS